MESFQGVERKTLLLPTAMVVVPLGSKLQRQSLMMGLKLQSWDLSR